MADDPETKKILTEQQLLSEVTNHQGWGVVRRIFADKILELQNAFDIETASPTTMMRDLQARKKASEILFNVLREIEGASTVMEEQKPQKKKSHILDLE